MEKLILLL